MPDPDSPTQKTRADEIRVLLVEDELDFALAVTRMVTSVSSESMHVQHVRTLQGALAVLDADGSIDCVLLDLFLPDSSGVDGIETLLDHESHPALIVLTGYDEPDIAAEALRAGAQDFLTKHALHPEGLTGRIRLAIDRHQRLSRLTKRQQALARSGGQISNTVPSPQSALRAVSQALLSQIPLIDEIADGHEHADRLAQLAADVAAAAVALDSVAGTAGVRGAAAGRQQVDLDMMLDRASLHRPATDAPAISRVRHRDLGVAWTDPGVLVTVLDDLAKDEGGGVDDVWTLTRRDEHATVVLTLDGGRHRASAPSGLRMALVRDAMERSGGSARIERRADRFVVELLLRERFATR